MKLPIPMPVSRAITKLGRDLSLARRRRRLSQASLAKRMGVSLTTLKRLENGGPRVAIEFVARALHVFGEIDRIDKLLDTREDALGLALMDEQLPQRVRVGRAAKPGRPSHAGTGRLKSGATSAQQVAVG